MPRLFFYFIARLNVLIVVFQSSSRNCELADASSRLQKTIIYGGFQKTTTNLLFYIYIKTVPLEEVM